MPKGHELPVNREASNQRRYQIGAVHELAKCYPIQPYQDNFTEITPHVDWIDDYDKTDQKYQKKPRQTKAYQRYGAKSSIIKASPDQLKKDEQLTGIYKTIRDIFLQSFVPAKERHVNDMLGFLQSLLVRYSVYVFESSVKKVQNRAIVKKSVTTGFMIVEKNFCLSNYAGDTACVIHLLAVAPEARGFGVGGFMVNRFVQKFMKGNQLIVSVMYPHEMLPMATNTNVVVSLQKSKFGIARRANRSQKIGKHKSGSPVNFFMNKLGFLVWDFIDEQIKQHFDLRNVCCMFGERTKFRSINFEINRLTEESKLYEVQYSNCHAMRVTSVDTQEGSEYRLNMQTCLIGRVDITLARVDKVQLENGVNSLFADRDQTEDPSTFDNDWHESFKESLIENLWSQSRMNRTWKKRVRRGILEYLGTAKDGMNLIKDDYVNIRGMGDREGSAVLRDCSQVEFPDEQDRDIQFYTKTCNTDVIALVPEEMRQTTTMNRGMCAYLSALLLVRSRDRLKGITMLNYMRTKGVEGELSNLPFFMKNNAEACLYNILMEFGYCLKRIGKMTYHELFASLKETTYLCSVETKDGMHHCVALDAVRNVLWDASCERMRMMTKAFFANELNCDERKADIFLVEVMRQKGRHHECSTWIDRMVRVRKDGRVRRVLYVDSNGGNKNQRSFGVLMEGTRLAENNFFVIWRQKSHIFFSAIFSSIDDVK